MKFIKQCHTVASEVVNKTIPVKDDGCLLFPTHYFLYPPRVILFEIFTLASAIIIHENLIKQIWNTLSKGFKKIYIFCQTFTFSAAEMNVKTFVFLTHDNNGTCCSTQGTVNRYLFIEKNSEFQNIYFSFIKSFQYFLS